MPKLDKTNGAHLALGIVGVLAAAGAVSERTRGSKGVVRLGDKKKRGSKSSPSKKAVALDNHWFTVNDAHSRWDEGEIGDDEAYDVMKKACGHMGSANTGTPTKCEACHGGSGNRASLTAAAIRNEAKDVIPAYWEGKCGGTKISIRPSTLLSQAHSSLYDPKYVSRLADQGVDTNWLEWEAYVHPPGEPAYVLAYASNISDLVDQVEEELGVSMSRCRVSSKYKKMSKKEGSAARKGKPRISKYVARAKLPEHVDRKGIKPDSAEVMGHNGNEWLIRYVDYQENTRHVYVGGHESREGVFLSVRDTFPTRGT